MKRVGVAASKIAKDNLFLYNFYVVLISSLFSLFIFIVSGFVVTFALIIIGYVGKEIMLVKFERDWSDVLVICMISLTIITAIFNLLIISKNIRLNKLK
ncbi:MAG: hypothetical protein A2Y03_01435 [Omnitrophica WOR_2 bacterium GWF2_38_59]|nr:MAG: hypothetical protein A2Y03_01435 [Omnitrophica WOR_2 bacterium GWF2_38_59]OGX49718.1 MAG: hypothetical protein A2243_10820 [Omnitrophica WOR_2 bacterium RIFOXYA2_FULL_38_17]OGX52520.1 MAG: hypothetical protein A2267_05055 [Omnitrophica WOR_2 bacterium RIFOXYA12_FULL_38_10]OGX55689.1 MAG: hypothetical protein A2447_11465 [Omnitrophica WOR_2 bacterium RIFOXYC2_FULL_38_12]OGX60137.1 MAG: hypothetical protein A2306_08925 [Omnitrophica WOR_2 bacterium RIFOXYB2_FULL_38_16]HBG61455.1 hypothet